MRHQNDHEVGHTSNIITLGPHNAEDSGFKIWNILGIFRQWWWVVAAIVLISTLATAYVVSRMTPIYMATSVLEVKQQERQVLDNSSEVQDFVVDNEFFNTQVELLRSKSLAGDIIDQFNLINDDDFVILEGTRGEKRAEAIKIFLKKLRVAAVGRSRLIQVSFEHSNRIRARDITNAVTESFITYNLERKYNATSYARDFIEDRLKSTKEILENSERELVKYASENDLVTVQDDQGNVSPGFLASESLISLNAQLLKAQTKRVELEKKLRIVESNPSEVNLSNDRVLSDLRQSHTDLTTEYIEKSATYVPEFPAMVELQSRIDYIDERIKKEATLLQKQDFASHDAEYQIALEAEQDILNRFNRFKNSFENIRDKSVEYNILKREVDTNRSQYDALLQRLKEVSIADEIGSNLISLVDRADTPRKPFRPRLALSILIACFLSSLLGTGLVLLMEFIDDRIKSPDHVKQKLGSIVMGVIPKHKTPKNIVSSLSDPSSAVAEAYSTLRTNLQFSGVDGGPQVIHITSTRSGEGKSVTSLGLALRYAGLGDKILLIDADMRLPTFKHGVDQSVGLSGLLTSTVDIDDNLLQTKYDDLDLLPSGANVPNPSEILSTYRLREIIEYLRTKYTYIIVDSPPVMGLADAPILAAMCDASLLVVEGASTRTPSVKATLERLSVSGIKVLGVVITKYALQAKGYYSYYQYSYGEGATNYSSFSGKKTKASVNKSYMNIMN